MPSKRPSSLRPKLSQPKRRTVRRLPSLEAFEAMTLPQRTKVFAAWLKRQPRGRVYEYFDTERCALAQFCSALAGPKAAGAGGHEIFVKREDDETNPFIAVVPPAGPQSAPLFGCTTFGALSDALHAALAEEADSN